MSVRVPLRLCVCSCARGCLRASVRVRGCAAAWQRPCGCVCSRACCDHLCARAGPCARAHALARVSVHACVRVRVRVWACRAIGKHLRASSRMCVRERACACVRGTTVCARLGAEWALWGPAVLIARPAAAARARLRSGATGFRCRARLPQAEPSATAPSRRNGRREKGTRRWSTPPAPSTSSAAKAAAAAPAASPTTTTSGRAPTEVRGPDSVGGCTGWVLRGY